MIRAIARQAEAERSRRAKIINAEGEQQAAQKLIDAARILATIVFPFPIDLMQGWASQMATARESNKVLPKAVRSKYHQVEEPPIWIDWRQWRI